MRASSRTSMGQGDARRRGRYRRHCRASGPCIDGKAPYADLVHVVVQVGRARQPLRVVVVRLQVPRRPAATGRCCRRAVGERMPLCTVMQRMGRKRRRHLGSGSSDTDRGRFLYQ